MQAEEQNIRDALASVNGEARPALRITLQPIERQGWYEFDELIWMYDFILSDMPKSSRQLEFDVQMVYWSAVFVWESAQSV